MKLLKLNESPYIGNFALSTNNYLLLPSFTPDVIIRGVEEELGANAYRVTIADSYLVGILACGNSKGLIVSPYTSESELEMLETVIRVGRLPSFLSAAGNIILANDHAAIVHPKLSDHAIDMIEDILDVNVERATIAHLRTVGAMGVATNKGVLVNPDITDNELSRLEEIFSLPVVRGTANFGSGLPGSSIIANDRGYVAGCDTTAIEIGRIEDALEL